MSESKDTVTISLREYNRLRDFETNIKEGKCYYTFSGLYRNKATFLTESEAIEKMSKDYDIADKERLELAEKLKTIREEEKERLKKDLLKQPWFIRKSHINNYW